MPSCRDAGESVGLASRGWSRWLGGEPCSRPQILEGTRKLDLRTASIRHQKSCNLRHAPSIPSPCSETSTIISRFASFRDFRRCRIACAVSASYGELPLDRRKSWIKVAGTWRRKPTSVTLGMRGCF